MSIRVLITGSRNWTDPVPIRKALTWVMERHKVEPLGVTVVHGAALGADSIAGEIASELGMNVEPHPADWKTHGKKAGPLRNAEMVALGADVCFAFPVAGSIGTRDCARKAKAAGISTYEYGDVSE